MKRLLRPTLILLAALCASASTAQTTTQGPLKTITIRVKEGTTLSFDLSPDGRSIVFDLLGQLWLVPVPGGKSPRHHECRPRYRRRSRPLLLT
jgi:hypothetical protein